MVGIYTGAVYPPLWAPCFQISPNVFFGSVDGLKSYFDSVLFLGSQCNVVFYR